MLPLPPDFWSRLWKETRNLAPLFRYLILQTETHAFCLALACAALIGFFPSCLVVMSVLGKLFHWDMLTLVDFQTAPPLAYRVMRGIVQGYFLGGLNKFGESFVTSNILVKYLDFRHGNPLGSILWVVIGAAGVFVPLEAGLNRLWRIHEDRPYWKNQLVGFCLTLLCTLLGLAFVLISTAVHWILSIVPFEPLHNVLSVVTIHIATTITLMLAVFFLYVLLPNKKIPAREVLPAAVLAGLIMEVVRVIYLSITPDLAATQGPFSISVTFLGLAYIETFVVLGCAFLASNSDRYPWIGFVPGSRTAKGPQ